MMGKPHIDFSTVVEGLLPNIPDEAIEKMESIGFKYCGPAPHCMNKYADHWFHLHYPLNEYKKRGITGFAVHIVEKAYVEDGLMVLIHTRDYMN